MKDNKAYLISSGNLFADIKASNAEERHAKMELAYQINTSIDTKNLKLPEIKRLLEIDQSSIFALNAGKVSRFSVENLLQLRNILDLVRAMNRAI